MGSTSRKADLSSEENVIIIDSKLEVAVGLIPLGAEERLMGGPITAVAARAVKGYVIITPGTTKKSMIAQTLAKAFHVSTDIVEKVLPPGDCAIVKTIGFELH